MTNPDILARLQGFPAFQSWKPRDLEDLANQLEVLQRSGGEVIFGPPISSEDIFIVNKGRVRQAVSDEQGQEIWTRTVAPGELFGPQALLHGGMHVSTATAESDCEIFRVRARIMAWALNKYPELWKALRRPDVATRLRAVPLLRSLTDAQIEQLAKDTRVREFAPGRLVDQEDDTSTPEEAEGGLWVIDWGQVETVGRYRVTLDPSGKRAATPETKPDSREGDVTPPVLTAGNWFCTGLVTIRNQRIIQGRAKTQLRTLFIPAVQAEQLAQRFPDVEAQLSRLLSIDKVLASHLTDEAFGGLTPAHWLDLAGYTGWEHVPRGFAVTKQGDQPDTLFILIEGQAVVRALDEEGRDRPSHVLTPFNYYGLGALLARERSDATIRAINGLDDKGAPMDGSDWLALHRQDLLYMTDSNPALWSKTPLRTELTRAPRRRKHRWLDEGETELYYDRRHWIVLVPGVLPLMLVLAVSAGLLLSDLSRNEDLKPWLVLLATLSAGVAVIGLPLVLWNYLDDYYAISDRRVIRRKRVLLFYDNQIEAPLTSVQDVSVEMDFVGNLLNYGDMSIQTAAEQGRILFDKVPDPRRVEGIVFEQTRRLQAGREAVRQESLREAIIKDLKLRLFAYRGEQVLPAGLSLERPSWVDALRQRVPHRLKATPRPDATVFRKHKIFLLKRTIVPLLALLVAVPVALAGFISLGEVSDVSLLARCAIWLLPVAAAIWLWYQYENWRNDEYILTDSHIIDIEASPLRFREKRRQAEWAKVQNVNYNVKGFVARFFNYGTVVIQTAAAVGQFDFINVGNPRRVQREIFERLENHRAQRENESIRRQQNDFRRALRTYDDLLQEDEWPNRAPTWQPYRPENEGTV